MKPVWTPAEDSILLLACRGGWTTTRMLARLPGRSLNGLRERARRLGLAVPE